MSKIEYIPFPKMEIDLPRVAERASALFIEKARRAGHRALIPDGPVYSPADVDNILEALQEIAGELQREKEIA